MRAGIFSDVPSYATETAIAEGLRLLGAAVVFQRIGAWTEDQAQPFDLVVLRGLHDSRPRRVRDFYRARGVPVLIHDLPSLRKPGYFALWCDEINGLPEAAPADRLGMCDLRERKSLGSTILLCGQSADDAAHGRSKIEIQDHFGAVSAALQAEHPECRIVWRPHPQEPFDLYWCDETQDPHEIPFEDALEADLFAVATLNSTCGVTALEAGVPVFCHPEAFYAHLAGHPRPAGRREFFQRISYAQWALDELRTAEPYLFNLPAEIAA